MRSDPWKETLAEQKVTYTLEVNGKLIEANSYSLPTQ
jgi:hypothetical protein